jgi:hypothetical protein
MDLRQRLNKCKKTGGRGYMSSDRQCVMDLRRRRPSRVGDLRASWALSAVVVLPCSGSEEDMGPSGGSSPVRWIWGRPCGSDPLMRRIWGWPGDDGWGRKGDLATSTTWRKGTTVATALEQGVGVWGSRKEIEGHWVPCVSVKGDELLPLHDGV